MTGKFFLIMLFELSLEVLVKICFFFNLDIFITHILKCLYQSLLQGCFTLCHHIRFVYYCRYNTIFNSKNTKKSRKSSLIFYIKDDF